MTRISSRSPATRVALSAVSLSVLAFAATMLCTRTSAGMNVLTHRLNAVVSASTLAQCAVVSLSQDSSVPQAPSLEHRSLRGTITKLKTDTRSASGRLHGIFVEMEFHLEATESGTRERTCPIGIELRFENIHTGIVVTQQSYGIHRSHPGDSTECGSESGRTMAPGDYRVWVLISGADEVGMRRRILDCKTTTITVPERP